MSDTVWITGGASGVGAACARKFAAAGASVGCIDIAAAGDDVPAAHSVVCDVTDPAAVGAAADELEDALGPASIAVLAAGVRAVPTPIADLDPADWDAVVAVNLTGVFLTMQAAIRSIRRGGGGSIVVIASAAGLQAGPLYSAYDSAKHGTIGLMTAAANEVAADGIRVNAVCPGWIDTPMLDAELADLGLDRETGAAKLAEAHLIKRLVQPGEVADAAAWLSSANASMVTGVALPIDGGLLAGVFSE